MCGSFPEAGQVLQKWTHVTDCQDPTFANKSRARGMYNMHTTIHKSILQPINQSTVAMVSFFKSQLIT